MPLRAALLDIRLGRRAERGAHGLRHVPVRLEAALADARADSGAHVGGMGAEHLAHPAKRDGNQPLRRAAPPGVNGADGRGKDDERQVRRVADHRVHTLIVALAPEALARVRPGHKADIRLVYLLAEHDAHGIRADGGAEAPEILLHVLRRIAPADAEVQRIPRCGADAAGPRGKAVADGAVEERARVPEQSAAAVCFK